LPGLDIGNELLKNLEWLKGLSEEEIREAIKRIIEYVKKGYTAEEAIKKVREELKEEAEKYIKEIERGIFEFCGSISDRQLAGEVEDLLRHMLNNVEADKARWLLSFLSGIYYGALAESNYNREYANDKLRKVVERFFEYPRSRMEGCRLASAKVTQLMKMEAAIVRRMVEEALGSESGEIFVGEFEVEIKSRYIYLRGKKFEPGLYLIRVPREGNREAFEWSTEVKEASNVLHLQVPERFSEEFLKELAGKKVKVLVYKYDYALHFKCEGKNFYFSPREGLIVDGVKVEIERVESREWSTKQRASMLVKLPQRSIMGSEVYLIFHEGGEVSFLMEKLHSATLRVEKNLPIGNLLLIIEHEGKEAIVPITVLELKVGEKYYLNIGVKGRGKIRLAEELKKIFGYSAVEELRMGIGEGKLMLWAHFDKGEASCTSEGLGINIPEGAEALEYIIISPYPEFSYGEKLSDEKVEEIDKASKRALGDIYGGRAAQNYIERGNIPEVGEPKFIGVEAPIVGRGEKVDMVFMMDDNKLVIVEVKASKTSEEALANNIRDGLKQLAEYRELIQKYGLDLTEWNLGVKTGEDVKAYILVYVYFDLKNKEVRVGHVWLSGG
ncbi:MAG: hypothetical protein FGF50_08955, partial [Candidatus Brockarchaeota archaeon]|nr:hypothetical protein [Candidatus Brockarchaeota archaeon]